LYTSSHPPALTLALIALAIPSGYIGFMGFLPVLIGLKRLWSVWRKRENGAGIRISAAGAIMSVTAVTIANGGDNIAVYVPIIASHTVTENLVICWVFAVMTGLWCLTGKLLVSHPAIGRPIRYWGHAIVPFVLMGIGVYVLAKTGAIHAFARARY
jgi:cadmium resistance protein CadD (predicted permease)